MLKKAENPPINICPDFSLDLLEFKPPEDLSTEIYPKSPTGCDGTLVEILDVKPAITEPLFEPLAVLQISPEQTLQVIYHFCIIIWFRRFYISLY